MTVNEVKKHLKICKESRLFIPKNDVLDTAIQALEEIQEYRAIGTVERLKHLEEYVDTINKLCADYSAIGTVDEFKALKDGSIPIIHGKAELELYGKEIRAKAIDEYVEKLKYNFGNDEELDSWATYDEIAEQLKAGGKNEIN